MSGEWFTCSTIWNSCDLKELSTKSSLSPRSRSVYAKLYAVSCANQINKVGKCCISKSKDVRFVGPRSLVNHLPTFVSKQASYTKCVTFSQRGSILLCLARQQRHLNIKTIHSNWKACRVVCFVQLESTLPKHSCEGRFSAAERQSITLQYSWSILRGLVVSAILCTRRSTYPDLHYLCVTTSGCLLSAVCSPREALVVLTASYSLMWQTIDSMEHMCRAARRRGG